MMIKAIYMHTKPFKYTKKHANANELHQTNTRFSKFLTTVNFWKHFSKTPEVIICKNEASRCPGLFKKYRIYSNN